MSVDIRYAVDILWQFMSHVSIEVFCFLPDFRLYLFGVMDQNSKRIINLSIEVYSLIKQLFDEDFFVFLNI